jgi:SNF2 family DNA or RNA helicase
MIPMKTQIQGAEFLAARRRAFLWDLPRVGKTGAAILAADYVLARTILVVTTASGRPVWRRAFKDWSNFNRSICVVGVDPATDADVKITSWNALDKILFSDRPDLIILDEDHAACNPEAKRSQTIYGRIIKRSDRVWHLSGTPLPHDLGNTWVRMYSSCPDRLRANPTLGWPDVRLYSNFRDRYCIKHIKKLSNFNKTIVVRGGQNEAELRDRLEGMYLRRTQQDVGIRPPSYELMPLIVTKKQREEIERDVDRQKVIEAAESGDTKKLDMELGSVLRLTGEIKAHAVVDAVKEEFENGLEKIVLAYWHREVGQILVGGLFEYGVVMLDGRTSKADRENIEATFARKDVRVFLAQIAAAGEAIDLSAANELWCVESVFSPKAMQQVALRITNVKKERNCFVKVCSIEGSIDEIVQSSLIRLWASIRGVTG